MSGRGMIPADVPALVRLACRLREETHGCGPWDEPGVAKQIQAMRTWNLEVVVEQILRRATDPEARTPAALLHKMSSPLPSERPKGRPQPPKKGQDCPRHPGQPKGDACGGCRADALAAADDDGHTAAPAPTWTPGDAVAGARACRAALGRSS